MITTRREFIKDATTVGAVVAAGGDGASVAEKKETEAIITEDERCPYFDQPMFCKGLSKTGKPLCDE